MSLSRLLIALLALAAGSWSIRATAGSVTTAVPAAVDVRDLALRLSVPNNRLTVGQPILLSVQINLLRNGTLVMPTDPSAFIHWGFQPRVTLQAEQTFTYQWSDPSVGVGYYYPLSYWGFKQTLPAGHYVLYVSPAHVIGRRAGHRIATARTVMSNEIELTVSP